MNVKAFGASHPPPDARLTGAGSSSLEFMKKALSFYMPHKENWDDEKKCGNPTRSKLVKELLHRVVELGGTSRKRKGGAAGDGAVGDDDGDGGVPTVASDGPRGLLRRMHAQNGDFITILGTMGTALRTFSRSVEQMKAALETNNIAIRHELSTEDADVGEDGGDDHDDDGDDEDAREGAPQAPKEMAPPVDIPAIDAEMRSQAAHVAEVLDEFMNANVVTNRRVLSGADGFCTFGSERDPGRRTDVPDGFDLPSVDLLRAWRHWIMGFPEFKVRNDDGEVVDAPIRPLQFVNTTDLPQSLKKKFKDGWRPILMSMQGDVAHMLETTPGGCVDERFVQDTYNAAMSALVAKAPGIFAESNAEKCGTWKVATWSRKIREQQLGQQQVKRREESSGSGGIAMFPPTISEEGQTQLQDQGRQSVQRPLVQLKTAVGGEDPLSSLSEERHSQQHQVQQPPSPITVPLNTTPNSFTH